MEKKLIALCAAAAAVTIVLGAAVYADENDGYGIFVGNVEITAQNLTVDSEDVGSGVSSGSIVYNPQDGTLTADNAVVAPEGAAALHITPGVDVELVLVGENEFIGDEGCAGIFVEAGWDTEGNFIVTESAQLTISGTGSLLTVGGDAVDGMFGAGAGIGGNGFGEVSGYLNGGDFGYIVIEGGNITANGGDDALVPSGNGSNYGAGAGIGGGGVKGNSYSFNWTYCGIIEINGGTVTANGGDGYVGGAGIGNGSAGSSDGTLCNIETNICGGTVTANAGTDAAGIGGSSNGASGVIEISGGTVFAYGGDEGDDTTYGGAGIGGGDNGESGEIIISGDANVTAVAGGAAAGIGGGNYGYVSDITICDNASVTAYGGSAITSSGEERGGAAIGSANQGDFGGVEKIGRITINTTNKVVAYGGKNAMSIGVGTYPKSKYYFSVGASTGEIWMFNKGTAQPAYIDDPEYLIDYRATLTAQYTHAEGAEFPEEGVISKAVTLPGSVDIDWKYENNALTVLRDGEIVISGEYDSNYELGNWAVVIPQVDMYVTYAWDGDIPADNYAQTLPEKVKVNHGDEFTVDTTFTADTVIENIVDGIKVGEWTFSGWDKSGTITIGDSITINGTWTYNGYLVVEFEKSVDDEGKPIVNRDERIYDINIVSYYKEINRLNSGDLTFILDQINGKNAYEIIDIDGDNITVEAVDENRYEFHFDTKTAVTNDSGFCITVARVKFTGYGKFEFAVDAAADTNVAHTTTEDDNIVDTYAPGGVLDGKNVGTLLIIDTVEEEIFAPTQQLTINVSFPNTVENNKLAYQDMNVLVTGDDIADISIDLGKDNLEEVALTLNNKNEASYDVDFDEEKSVYTIVIKNALTANTTYNVTVSGAGYRTAKYTVTMTEDKTLNFWNNVKDNAVEVEEKKASSAKNVTFLAGDIVKDSVINIYDLSAVVSYFGEINLSETNNKAYAKYDLNRDGKIDSKDVAYVLVSWGK